MDFKPERSVYLDGEINGHTCAEAMMGISKLYSADQEAPITLFISSGGGNVSDAFALYDYIMTALRPNLQTVALGEANSVAVILFLMGEKRYVGNLTILKLHEFSFTPEGSSSVTARGARKMAKSLELSQTKYADIIANRSGMPKRKVRALMRKKATILPAQAVELGLAHQVL